MNNKKFIKLLQTAHAGESAAIVAYIGHYFRTRDLKINKMIQDELYHRDVLLYMLEEFDKKPSYFKDMYMIFIGIIVFLSCFLLPIKYLNKGASLIEKFGAGNYEKLSKLSLELGHKDISNLFREFEETEKQHGIILNE